MTYSMSASKGEQGRQRKYSSRLSDYEDKGVLWIFLNTAGGVIPHICSPMSRDFALIRMDKSLSTLPTPRSAITTKLDTEDLDGLFPSQSRYEDLTARTLVPSSAASPPDP